MCAPVCAWRRTLALIKNIVRHGLLSYKAARIQPTTQTQYFS